MEGRDYGAATIVAIFPNKDGAYLLSGALVDMRLGIRTGDIVITQRFDLLTQNADEKFKTMPPFIIGKSRRDPAKGLVPEVPLTLPPVPLTPPAFVQMPPSPSTQDPNKK